MFKKGVLARKLKHFETDAEGKGEAVKADMELEGGIKQTVYHAEVE